MRVRKGPAGGVLGESIGRYSRGVQGGTGILSLACADESGLSRGCGCVYFTGLADISCGCVYLAGESKAGYIWRVWVRMYSGST